MKFEYELSPVENDLEKVQNAINNSRDYLEKHKHGLFAKHHERKIK